MKVLFLAGLANCFMQILIYDILNANMNYWQPPNLIKKNEGYCVKWMALNLHVVRGPVRNVIVSFYNKKLIFFWGIEFRKHYPDSTYCKSR